MIILALDLGAQMGWSVALPDGSIKGGSVSFAPKLHGGHGQRFLAFVQFLIQTQSTHGQIHAVYYEDVKRHAGTLAAHAYGGFLAVLQIWCANNNKTGMYPLGVGVIKKAWTGNGSAKKDLMIEAAKQHGFDPIDDNHADALAIMAMACAHQRRPFPARVAPRSNQATLGL